MSAKAQTPYAARIDMQVGEKDFGFETSMFYGRWYATGREVFINQQGAKQFGRNGVTIDVSHGPEPVYEFIQGLMSLLHEAFGLDVDEIMTNITDYGHTPDA